MTIRYRLALAVALLLQPVSAQAAWQEARSAHFTVYADDKPDKVKDFTTRLERYDRALRALFGIDPNIASSSMRVTIYVVNDADDVAKLAGKGANVAGFYIPRAHGAVAFAPRNGRGNGPYSLTAQTVLMHEYAHHFMFSSWPNIAVPGWFTEGFAEFSSTALFDKSGSITLGSPPLYRTREILDPTLSMKRLIAANVDSLPQAQRSQLYGRGWALTHYVMLSPERRKLFGQYLAALNAGKTPLEAAAVFGDLDKLDRELTRYVTQRLSGFVVAADKLPIEEITVAPLSAGAAATMEARIRSTRGVRAAVAPEIYALAAKAAAPYPNDPAAQVELAEAAYDARDYATATAAADRAIAADPKSLYGHIYKGRAAMAIALRDNLRDSAHWAAIRRSFLAANKIDTENAEPLILFYQSFIAAHEIPTKNAQDGLLYAYVLAPFDPNLRLTAANLMLRRDDGAGARKALAPVAYDPHGGDRATFAGKVIAALDAKGTAAALAIISGRSDGDGDEEGKSGGSSPAK